MNADESSSNEQPETNKSQTPPQSPPQTPPQSPPPSPVNYQRPPQWKSEGVTIILTTHYLEEAEKICNRIGILNKGNLVALDSTINLIKKIQTKKITFKLDKNVNIITNQLESLNIISNIDKEFVITYEKNKINIEEIIKLIQKNNAKIVDLHTDDGDLEDVFLTLTKN